ncbi:hypothetical protein [Chitinophaga vietnamensis]|uniref:hypothetical protein n=1 Tax=Chitinophaga vietnamensis TaxID=2593957 RepID=UPI001178651E|nr:hypothetical protein [Chitinophaga vietnamensis]
MKVSHLLMTGGIALTLLASCGSGNKPRTDSASNATTDTASMMPPDTAPAAQQPPGAINPGEDSARYGTGAQDSSKHRKGHK